MPKKLKKVPPQPGMFRTALTSLEYDMLILSVRRQLQRYKYQKNPASSKRRKHYLSLLHRLQHGKARINEQLTLYRKANGMVRCEYLEQEDRP